MILNADEVKCVRQIAKWFEENKDRITREEAMKALGLDRGQYEVTLRRMEAFGVVERVINDRRG